MNYIYVAIGGIIGTTLRYLLSFVLVTTTAFPIHTWCINILGSFCLGFVSFRPNISNKLKLLIGVGTLGSFTTFSTFSYNNVQLLTQGHVLLFAVYMISSIILGFLFAYLGMKLAQRT